MKTNKQLTIIILITGLLVTGIVYGEDPVKGSVSDTTTSGNTMGWQEQTKRVTVFTTDGLKLSTGLSANTSGVGFTFGVSSSFTLIECCRMTTLKQSWCNYSADDERCAD